MPDKEKDPRSSRSRDKGGDKSGKNKDRSRSKTKSRSRSPVRTENSSSSSSSSSAAQETMSAADLKQMMRDALKEQIPSLILETSKVVTAQMTADRVEAEKSFTSFSQEMKLLKQKQEEIAYQSKAASLNSEGKTEITV